MARASVPTLLSLDRFAKIMGINPVHFQGASAPPVWNEHGSCRELWTQYSWQNEDVSSREELAQGIFDAEKDIARILGYQPAPTWTSDEPITVPKTRFVTDYRQSMPQKLRWGEVIAGGRRGSTLIDDDATIVYSDADGDGFSELAIITLTVPDEIVDANQVRVYFNDHGSNPCWEIRPARSRTLSGHVATLIFDSWLFIIPDYAEVPAGEWEYNAINIINTDNFVSSCTLYRVWNDLSQSSVVAYRSGGLCGSCSGIGCNACATYIQDGCLYVSDAHLGIVNPIAASYSSVDSLWHQSSYSLQLPFSFHFWYYSGAVSDEYRDGWNDDPMPTYLAQSIAYLAAARLDKPFCQCGNVEKTLAEMRRDLGLSAEGNTTHLPFDSVAYSNPFGTRVGEVKAWHRISNLVGNQVWDAAVV